GKGGVGKTTAVANLAVALVADGKKVVCIDGDIGLRNLDVVMGLENRIVYDIVDVIEGRCRLRQAMIRDKHFQDLYLIPAAQTRDKTAVTPSDMIRLCDELRPDYDFILIDSPAGIERGFRNAIAPADKVLVVTNPEVSAVRDADRVVGILEAEEKPSPALIINRLNPSMVKNHEMLSAEDVLDLLGIQLIGVVPEDENVIVGSNRGTPVALEPKSRAGQAFRNIAKRLQGFDVPFMELDHSGFWARIQRLTGRRKDGWLDESLIGAQTQCGKCKGAFATGVDS
ncbi:MAG: septum site-determining protein MinD, partial [Anaerolineae bacterium]